ncbi:PRAME family member 12-like [Mesocricetus auratus]|uniref:PRAME family member 12-like n=1 Tax=Mesocricetus auratus TaxID=10036 RepID=A0A1U7RFY6_MESAU|nr:PRAME family member 12-like [Mesocricetus auratus]
MNSPSSFKLLAVKSLLKDEALAICALKALPMELFPPLFQGAFDGKQTNILRAMVAAWPFRCLPVGSLKKTPDLEILKALLDGLDLLIKQKDTPMSCKLEVLDLRDTQHNFWKVWAGTEDVVCFADVVSESQPAVRNPIRRGKQVVTVRMDLSLKSRDLCKSLKYFHWWAKQRKGMLQVICEKLEFGARPVYKPLKLLEVFEPSSIQELEVNAHWDLRTLAMFAPGLEQVIARDPDEGKADLRRGAVFKYLESPLETLAITRCKLSESDMRYLSQCPSVCHLTYLDQSGVTFLYLSHPLLGRLLERLTATLQTLKLKDCMLMNFQIDDLLPALSQCSQLVEVNFVHNLLSVSSLKKLLQHTANLRKLTLEMYPAPTEVYNAIGDVIPDRFVHHCSELLETLRGVRELKEIYFVNKRCLHCRTFCVYDLEAFLCSCWE